VSQPLARIIPLRRTGSELSDLGDDALVAACATADPVARAALFEKHVDAVHRFVSRMWRGEPTEIDDLVQATFLAAYRSAGRFQAGGRARSWLYGIAANLTRDHARREGRRVRALSAIAAWYRDEPAVFVDPADRERLARLPDALAALPHDLRVVFVLVDLEGQSSKEAATALGVPEGTVWRRMFHARRRIRAFVDGGDR
jgi:RNA polymerase sigma-70 factor (ECF subfamily)